jgi:hypothetical protein
MRAGSFYQLGQAITQRKSPRDTPPADVAPTKYEEWKYAHAEWTSPDARARKCA